MTSDWQSGRWLVFDAAGPALVLGILEEGDWRDHICSREGFLESLKPGVEKLLADAGISLDSLNGVIFASGPGSTLGLRLAAMFVRTLLQQPQLQHWDCLTYNNLQLACAAQCRPGGPEYRLAAPWRRDRLHQATYKPGPPTEFTLETVYPDAAAGNQIVELGNRMSAAPAGMEQLPYPADSIPQILRQWPELLTRVDHPELYSAEDPQFAKWSSTRHPQK